MLQPGDTLPTFELADEENRPLSSADLLGTWTLLFWFPKANTPGCTAQAQGLSDQKDAFDQLGCRIVGVSFDKPDQLRSFRDDRGLRIRLACDRSRNAAIAMGAAASVEDTVPRRIAFLIDGNLTIRARYEVSDPEFFAEDVLDDLERLSV